MTRLPPTSALPPLQGGAPFLSITLTDAELSIVAPEGASPAGARTERGFALLRVEGPIPFEQIGVMRSLADPLADAAISILAISTFDTDYLLVREARLADAVMALQRWGRHRLALRTPVADGRLRALVERSGFAVVEGVLDAGTCEGLLHAVDGWDGGRSRAGIRGLMDCREVAAIASDPRVRGLAESVLGSGVVPLRATLFAKSAGARWSSGWHQDVILPVAAGEDEPGWGPRRIKGGTVCAHAPARVLERVIALRIHLDDTGLEDGPLEVIPGSHELGPVLPSTLSEVTNGVVCVSKRGGVMLMRPLIFHASQRAAKHNRRRILHIEYASGPQLT